MLLQIISLFEPFKAMWTSQVIQNLIHWRFNHFYIQILVKLFINKMSFFDKTLTFMLQKSFQIVDFKLANSTPKGVGFHCCRQPDQILFHLFISEIKKKKKLKIMVLFLTSNSRFCL